MSASEKNISNTSFSFPSLLAAAASSPGTSGFAIPPLFIKNNEQQTGNEQQTQQNGSSVTSFHNINENVKRLQNQLMQTQHSMQLICERANMLKQKVAQKRVEKEQAHSVAQHSSASNSVDVSEYQKKIEQLQQEKAVLQQEAKDALYYKTVYEQEKAEAKLWKEKAQNEEQLRKQLEQTIRTLQASVGTSNSSPVPSNNSNNIDSSDKSTTATALTISQDEYLKVIAIQEQNRKLKQTLAETEAAVYLITVRSREQLLQKTEQAYKHIKFLEDQLTYEHSTNEHLSQENASLQRKLQGAIATMKKSLELRESELMEMDGYVVRVNKENEVLRKMLTSLPPKRPTVT